VMGAVHKLRRRTSPARSAAREQLSSAIERHRAALDQLERIQLAAEKARELEYAASSAVESARAQVSEAKKSEGAELADRLLAGGDDLKASSVTKAERGLREAEDGLRRARGARAALAEELPAVEREIAFSKSDLDAAVRAVLQAEIAGAAATLLREAQAVQADLVARRVVLRFLHGFFDARDDSALKTFLRNNNNVLPGCVGAVEHANFNDHEASAAWRAAAEALLTNADAPLPGL
jgi:hypothetical protein